MNRIFSLLCASMLLGLIPALTAPRPATALSADLAKKCRQMSFGVYPPKRVGVKKGDAAAQRQYYEKCIANGGKMPEMDNDQPAPSEPQIKNK